MDDGSYCSMTTRPTDLSIDEYLRERLMPVEGLIPHISGIEMYGNSVPVESVGRDLFEYINFQQRYDIDVRIQQALNLAKEFLDPARDICNALLEHATKDDDHLRQIGEEDRIDDKTVFIIKRG